MPLLIHTWIALTSAKYCSKGFRPINSLNCQKTVLGTITIPLGIQSSKTLSNKPKVTQLVSDRAKIQSWQTGFRVCPLNHNHTIMPRASPNLQIFHSFAFKQNLIPFTLIKELQELCKSVWEIASHLNYQYTWEEDYCFSKSISDSQNILASSSEEQY